MECTNAHCSREAVVEFDNPDTGEHEIVCTACFRSNSEYGYAMDNVSVSATKADEWSLVPWFGGGRVIAWIMDKWYQGSLDRRTLIAYN